MPPMALCSDRMVQLLLPTSWLSQARDWYVQFQLRLAIDPISLVTQSCILLTALAAGGYLLHLRGALRQERHRGRLLQHRGRLQQRWASLAAALLEAGPRNARVSQLLDILVTEMETPRWRPTAKSRGRALAAAMEPASKPQGTRGPSEPPFKSPPPWPPHFPDVRPPAMPAPPPEPAVPKPAAPKPRARPPFKVPPPYAVPCPKCGADLCQKAAKRGGFFWGCTTWPQCTGTRGLKEGQTIRDGLVVIA